MILLGSADFSNLST